LVLHGRLRQYWPARKVWDEMRGKCMEIHPPAINAILNAAAAAGDTSAAEHHLAEIRSEGWTLEREHFGCLIKAYRAVGDAERVMQLLDEMRTSHLRPTVVQYTTAMGVYSYSRTAASHATVARFAIQVCARMKLDRTSPDKYFVEEHLVALLGGASMSRFRWGKGKAWEQQTRARAASHLASLPRASVSAALKVIADARGQRIAMTGWVEVLETLLLDTQLGSALEETKGPAQTCTKAFAGDWQDRGTIVGTTLLWKSGRSVHICVTGANSFCIHLEGEEHCATLDASGRLVWSDGDIWTRAARP